MSAEEAIQIIDDLYTKVEAFKNLGKQNLDQQIADYYVTGALKLQLAQSICSLSGLCPSKTIVAEHEQLEQLNREYELSRAGGKPGGNFTREMYHQYGKKRHELNDKYQIEAEMQRGLAAS